MEHKIRLDRSYYARSDELLLWLIKHVGPGLGYYQCYTSAPPDQALWKWFQLFGCTYIEFKREEDLLQFTITWC